MQPGAFCKPLLILTIVRMFMKGVLAVIFCWAMASVREAAGQEGQEFTNMWVAEIHGGEGVAQRVARDLGYTFKGQAKFFDDHYVLTRADHPDISPRGSHELTQTLLDVDEVKWAEQQHILKRTTRENVPKRVLESNGDEGDVSKLDTISSADEGTLASCQGGNRNTKEDKAADNSKLGTFSTKPSAGKGTLATYEGVTKSIMLTSDKQSAYKGQFNDPLWYKQWDFQDYRTKPYPVMDHNTVPVYKMGITGKGVTVAIVDDGLQGNHPDLKANYNYSLSWDVAHDMAGSEPDDASFDITDLGFALKFHSHGTKCAGVVGMAANNGVCGVGVAYEATLAGVKLLSSPYTTYTESTALQYNLPSVDIYSNSWGPEDNGKVMGGIGRLSDMALTKGVTEGRNGKGAIYTFAAGNGRVNEDNCAADGSTNHIHTIGVAAAGQDGKWAYDSERCSAIFTTAYSGTHDYMEKIVATDLAGNCDKGFSGTSAATPVITGIIALTLQANPKLTYRDVMHLITMSSEVAPLADNGDTWYKNGRGFWVSNDFGFGLLNAENMVSQAKTWKTVPPVKSCVAEFSIELPVEFTVGKPARFTVKADGCKGTKDAVRYLEQVLVTATVQYPYRGAITLTLTSPGGTKTAILEPRPKDSDSEGLQSWTIKSVHNWGEKPQGTWRMSIGAASLAGVEPATGTVSEVKLTFYGTRLKPAHFSSLPREYGAFRLPNGKTSED